MKVSKRTVGELFLVMFENYTHFRFFLVKVYQNMIQNYGLQKSSIYNVLGYIVGLYTH